MIDKLINLLTTLDKRFTTNIVDFLYKYSFPSENGIFSEKNVLLLFKVSSYSLFFLMPLSFLKIIFPEKNWITIVFVLSLISFAISTFGVFVSFFQLLFV